MNCLEQNLITLTQLCCQMRSGPIVCKACELAGTSETVADTMASRVERSQDILNTFTPNESPEPLHRLTTAKSQALSCRLLRVHRSCATSSSGARAMPEPVSRRFGLLLETSPEFPPHARHRKKATSSTPSWTSGVAPIVPARNRLQRIARPWRSQLFQSPQSLRLFASWRS